MYDSSTTYRANHEFNAWDGGCKNETFKENCMSRPVIPIVFATNNAYAPYAAVTINSLTKNASPDFFYDIYVFHTELNNANITHLQSMAGDNYSVKCLCVERFIEREMKYMYTNFHFSKEMFYRILIPTILPQYDRVIYLDCDIVVLGDISEFYNIDLEGNIIAAGNDIMHGASRKYVTTELGLPVEKYINSGVLLIDCVAFRENQIKERCFEELAQRTELRYPDQDIINLTCFGKIKYLHRKWNYIWHYHLVRDDASLNLPEQDVEQYMEDAKDIRILHYTSSLKPWKNKNVQLSDHFWSYVDGTPYADAIKNAYNKIPAKNYVVTQFVEEKDGKLQFTASLYTLERWTLDDIVMHVDGNEAEFTHVYSHVADVANRIYRRMFFKFELDLSEISSRATIRFYHKETGLPISVKSAKTFPIEFSLNDTCYMLGKAIYAEANAVVVETATADVVEARKQERKAAKINKKDRAYIKSLILRACYNVLKPFFRKEIWIVSDRTHCAGDNGEAFFKYIVKNTPKGVKPVFAVDKSSPDYKRMKKYGKVISPSSQLYKIYFMFTTMNVTSQIEPAIVEPINCSRYLKDIIRKMKIVFLQHGIIKDDLSSCYNRCKHNMSIFVTSAKREYDSIVSNPAYHCGEDVTKLTGLARYDLLDDKREKLVFIVPTWRKSCVEDMVTGELRADIETSQFFRFYNDLLHNEKLISTAKRLGYKLCYYPHPLMNAATHLFGKLDGVFADASKYTYTDMFCKGSLLLTDYSSNQFDFAYLKKPVVYTQFDRAEFCSSHTYVPGYFSYEDDGFGEVVYDLDSTVNTLVEYMENDCALKDKYLERIESFYAYTDKNNCKRILEEIMKLK